MLEEGSSASERLTITDTLQRIGFLSGIPDTEQDAIVEALAVILPDERDVGVCVSYSDFSASGDHPIQERTCSFLRVLPPTFGSWQGPPLPAAIAKMQIVLCTSELLLWTSSHTRAIGAAVEERVTAYSLALSEILGAALGGRHKDVAKVWVDEGPTLSFHAAPDAAQALQVYVDTAASTG
jgi:hypothetical protein